MLHTHSVDLCPVTENVAGSEVWKFRQTQAAGTQQKHVPSAGLPITLPAPWQEGSWAVNEAWVSGQLDFCSVFGLNSGTILTGSSSARKQTAFDFTDVPGNLLPSIKRAWMWVKIWCDVVQV